jgi:hypothetical protein
VTRNVEPACCASAGCNIGTAARRAAGNLANREVLRPTIDGTEP